MCINQSLVPVTLSEKLEVKLPAPCTAMGILPPRKDSQNMRGPNENCAVIKFLEKNQCGRDVLEALEGHTSLMLVEKQCISTKVQRCHPVHEDH